VGRRPRRAEDAANNLTDRAGFEPRRGRDFAHDVAQTIRWVCGNRGRMPPARHGLKSGAESTVGRGTQVVRAEIFAPPSPCVLQFRGDHLLEFYDVGREFADTFRQFLSGHRVLVERETERFLVE